MNKFETSLSKHFNKIVLGLLLLVVINTCGNPTKPLNKRIDKLTHKVDSLSTIVVDKKDIRIEGLKTEKRMLLNTNQIFLTKERPDNRVLEIDKEIQSIK